jgi:amino acid transporter
MVGWLGVLGWQTAAATVSYLAGKQIQGLIVLNNPSYEPKAWQGTLLIWAVLAVCWIFNTFFSQKLPLIEGLIVILHVAGFFAVIIPLWVMGDRSSSGDVFSLFQDNMMWGNVPLSTIVGLTGAASCFIGVEAGAHMAEEVRNAAHVIPRAMMWTWLGNGLLGWVMAITFCFCVGDTLSVLMTPLGSPHIQVFVNATGSVAGATALTVLMLVISIFACVAVMATNSRQLFAFARDNGVPFSRIFSQVSESLSVRMLAGTNTVLGQPQALSTAELGLFDTYLRPSPLAHQHWVQRCLYAGHFPRCRCDGYFVSHLDLLHYVEETAWRAATAIKIRPGQVGAPYQHHLRPVLALSMDILLLPDCS